MIGLEVLSLFKAGRTLRTFKAKEPSCDDRSTKNLLVIIDLEAFKDTRILRSKCSHCINKRISCTISARTIPIVTDTRSA